MAQKSKSERGISFKTFWEEKNDKIGSRYLGEKEKQKRLNITNTI
jgi:hypothetical protein